MKQSFNIGDSVCFIGYFERGVTDYGIVGKHSNSNSLVIRGKMTGFTKCDYEIYLDQVYLFCNYKLRKLP